LPDFTFLGINFYWYDSFRWCSINWSKEYFHNQEEFIPGLSIVLANVGLDISQEKNW